MDIILWQMILLHYNMGQQRTDIVGYEYYMVKKAHWESEN